MRCKRAADVCYLHAITVESMLAGDGLPVASITVSKASKSRGIRKRCGMDTPEGSTDLVTLDSSVPRQVVQENMTYALSCLEMHLFNRNKSAISSFGVVGGYAGDALEKSLGKTKHLQFHAS